MHLEPPSTQNFGRWSRFLSETKKPRSRHDTKFALSFFECWRWFFVCSGCVSEWFGIMILARSLLNGFRFLRARRKQTVINYIKGFWRSIWLAETFSLRLCSLRRSPDGSTRGRRAGVMTSSRLPWAVCCFINVYTYMAGCNRYITKHP